VAPSAARRSRRRPGWRRPRHQRDAGEEAIGRRQRVLAQAEATQLYASKAAGDVLIELPQCHEDRGRIRLAEQDPAQRAVSR